MAPACGLARNPDGFMPSRPTRTVARDCIAAESLRHHTLNSGELRQCDAGPRTAAEGTTSWVTWNALAAWQAADDFELALRIENIGDKRYREHGTGLDEPGFNAIVTAELRF